MLRNGFFFLFLLVAVDVGRSQTDMESTEECVAKASAATDPNTATADAVANAVAETFSKSVQCDEEEGGLNSTAPPGLSIAVGLAISEAEELAQMCTSDANAQANITTMKVADDIRTLLGDATNQTTDEDKISMARIEALTQDLESSIMNQTEANAAEAELGIVPLAVPTAEEVATMIGEAINDILVAIQCEDEGGVEGPTEGEDGPKQSCIFLDGRFIGDCLKKKESSPPGMEAEAGTESTGQAEEGGEPRCLFLDGRLIC